MRYFCLKIAQSGPKKGGRQISALGHRTKVVISIDLITPSRTPPLPKKTNGWITRYNRRRS